MDIILHLGGNLERAHTAARLAQVFPKALIVVSSELGDYQAIYDGYGIARDRLIVNMEAWDTVTNFTHTYKLLQSLGCKRLFVVTDCFHSYRAMLIAFSVWGGRVPIYIHPHSYSILPSDEGLALIDGARALLWRLFGILLFSKKTKAERSQFFFPLPGHSKLEIGL